MAYKLIKYYIKFCLCSIAILNATAIAYSQTKKLVDEKVIIQKRIDIELSETEKNFKEILLNTKLDSSATENNINYSIKYFDTLTPPNQTTFNVVKIKNDTSQNPNQQVFTLGFGSYLSPLIETYLNNIKDSDINVNFQYFGSFLGPTPVNNSIKKNKSNNNMATFNVQRDFFTPNGKIDLSGSFFRHGYNYYGYPDNLSSTKINVEKANYYTIGIQSNMEDFKFFNNTIANHLDFSFTQQSLGSSSIYFNFHTVPEYHIIKNESSFGLDMNIFAGTTYGTELSSDNSFLLNPLIFYKQTTGKLLLEGGVGITWAKGRGTFQQVTSRIKLKTEYHLDDFIKIYASYNKDINPIKYETLLQENPFLKQKIDFMNLQPIQEIKGGVKGNLANQLQYDVGIKYSNMNNYYFFITDAIEINKFNLTYEDDLQTNLFGIYGVVSYTFNKNLQASIKTVYNQYITEFEKAWYHPYLEAFGSLSYSNKKILFNINTYSAVGIYTKEIFTDNVVQIKNIFDINAKINYNIWNDINVFINLYNILANEYQYYINYPNQGFQLLGGITIVM